MGLEDFLFCGKYKDKDGCGFLYYNLKDLCFYKEREYFYLERLGEKDNYLLNRLSGFLDVFVYKK
ncbi:MAG: hypothetical protein QXU20_03810 [Candidatus Woesearchaeota archaeon]